MQASAVQQPPPVVRAEKLEKTYRSGASEIRVLTGVNLEVQQGEIVAIVGPSGAGKSTLLHLLGALDTPTRGTVYFEQRPLSDFRDADLADYRNRQVGFVWQRHHLLPDFSAAENVAMPLLVRNVARGKAVELACQGLAEVGLADRAEHCAAQLSGGEQQRVAIARALVTRPKLLLADEPTGDLDERNAHAVFYLMQHLIRTYRLSSIMATHNLALAARCDRVLELEHGVLTPSGVPPGVGA